MRSIDELCAVAAVCALCAALCVTIKKYNPGLALLLSVGCCAALMLALLPAVNALKEELSPLAAAANGELFGCVVKAAGACLIAQFACDACSQAGQEALAGRVSFAGKLTALAFALPLMRELALTVGKLIGI